MKPFLQLVAEDLYQRFGSDLSRTAVIFPNKRASLFLNEHLAQISSTPVWAPRYLTISDFFLSLSDKVVADPIEVVCRLYTHYARLTKSAETLDYFYGWGERLASDFDDIDKNMANTESLFRDLKDYCTLTQMDTLDEQQVEELQRFAADFSADRLSHVKQRFATLWTALPELYHALRTELAAEGKAYEGQLFREVSEKLLAGSIALPTGIDHVAIVGFNVIDRVEQTLFETLQRSEQALFYWDYDTYYIGENGHSLNEAGLFMQDNLRHFPNCLAASNFSNFLAHRETRTLEFASAQTELAQAQSLGEWLADPQHYTPQHGKDTAIVLCNENLLQPVLHALPPAAKDTNITKGFPLSHTPAFTFVSQFIKEQRQAHDRAAAAATDGTETAWAQGESCLDTLARLSQSIQEEYQRVLSLSKTDTMLHDLYVEAFFQTITTLTRFTNLVETGLLNVQLPTLFSLIEQVLQRTSVPFHGEPLRGLQVMGVLETRCLDFRNVLVLSACEGILPQKSSENSFIPFLLRKMHGLTTPDRQISVYAYYFYRLLQRPQHVRLCYNTSTSDMQKGEMSRFMRALLAESAAELKIKHLALRSALTPIKPLQPVEQRVTLAYAQRVQQKGLSPSALKRYFKCKLAFYYHDVMQLKASQKPDGIIAHNDFGTILHKAAEIVYSRDLAQRGEPITSQRISTYLKEGGKILLARLVSEAYEEENSERAKNGNPLIPDSAIARRALEKYLRTLLQFEAGNGIHPAPAIQFSNVIVEQQSEIVLDVPVQGKTFQVRLYGYIDRRDEARFADRETSIRIIDYKTGKKKSTETIPSLETFFSEVEKYPDNALQVLIYSLMWAERGKPVVPMLYYVPSMVKTDFSPLIEIGKEPITDFRTMAQDFRTRLTEALSEILDPDKPFTPTPFPKHCEYCDFRELCGKG